MSENWRQVVDAETFFGHGKKRADIDGRRPTPRRASDLVGPGIDASAVSVADWKNTLATFNGYYSSVAGALNTPDAELPIGQREPFVGTTTMDSALGGVQRLLGLNTRNEWSRLFLRNPSDPTSITWTAWTRTNLIPEPTTTTYPVTPASNMAAGTSTPRMDVISGVVLPGGIIDRSPSAAFPGDTATLIGSFNPLYAPSENLRFIVPVGSIYGHLIVSSAGDLTIRPVGAAARPVYLAGPTWAKKP